MRCKQQAAATVNNSWVSDDEPFLCNNRQSGIEEAAHTYANHVGCATAVWLNVIHEGVPYLHATQTNGIIITSQDRPETCGLLRIDDWTRGTS